MEALNVLPQRGGFTEQSWSRASSVGINGPIMGIGSQWSSRNLLHLLHQGPFRLSSCVLGYGHMLAGAAQGQVPRVIVPLPIKQGPGLCLVPEDLVPRSLCPCILCLYPYVPASFIPMSCVPALGDPKKAVRAEVNCATCMTCC